jgi:hypothetical protein
MPWMRQKSWPSPIFGAFPRNGDFICLSRNYYELQHNASVSTSFKFIINSYYSPSQHVGASVNGNIHQSVSFTAPSLSDLRRSAGVFLISRHCSSTIIPEAYNYFVIFHLQPLLRTIQKGSQWYTMRLKIETDNTASPKTPTRFHWKCQNREMRKSVMMSERSIVGARCYISIQFPL